MNNGITHEIHFMNFTKWNNSPSVINYIVGGTTIMNFTKSPIIWANPNYESVIATDVSPYITQNHSDWSGEVYSNLLGKRRIVV